MLNLIATIPHIEAITFGNGVSNCGYSPRWEFRIHLGPPENKVGMFFWLPHDGPNDVNIARLISDCGVAIPENTDKPSDMLRQLEDIPGFTHLEVRKRSSSVTSDRMWIASAPSHHRKKGDRNVVFGMCGRTIQEAIELLIMALKENSAKRDRWPESRGTSAGELRRMHEEAEENT